MDGMVTRRSWKAANESGIWVFYACQTHILHNEGVVFPQQAEQVEQKLANVHEQSSMWS